MLARGSSSIAKYRRVIRRFHEGRIAGQGRDARRRCGVDHIGRAATATRTAPGLVTSRCMGVEHHLFPGDQLRDEVVGRLVLPDQRRLQLRALLFETDPARRLMLDPTEWLASDPTALARHGNDVSRSATPNEPRRHSAPELSIV